MAILVNAYGNGGGGGGYGGSGQSSSGYGRSNSYGGSSNRLLSKYIKNLINYDLFLQL